MLRLGFRQAAVAIAPSFFDAPFPAAERTGCEWTRIEDIPGISSVIVPGFETVEPTVTVNFASALDAGRAYRSAKILTGF
jgi:hypothetical protein